MKSCVGNVGLLTPFSVSCALSGWLNLVSVRSEPEFNIRIFIKNNNHISLFNNFLIHSCFTRHFFCSPNSNPANICPMTRPPSWVRCV